MRFLNPTGEEQVLTSPQSSMALHENTSTSANSTTSSSSQQESSGDLSSDQADTSTTTASNETSSSTNATTQQQPIKEGQEEKNMFGFQLALTATKIKNDAGFFGLAAV